MKLINFNSLLMYTGSTQFNPQRCEFSTVWRCNPFITCLATAKVHVEVLGITSHMWAIPTDACIALIRTTLA